MAGETLHSFEDQNTGLDTHQEPTDKILSRLDDEALRDLAETGTVEDVRTVVEMLIADNPELRPYLIEFQEANSAALAAELQRAAANDHLESEGADEVPEEEMHEYVKQAQSYLYEALDIDENLANNGALTNFAKGIVDTLIFENGDLALQVIETRWGVILDALKELATWRGIKWVLQALWESIWDLFSGDAYDKWKAVADLGLVATWVWVAATVWRKAVISAINALDTPSPNNLDRILLDDIVKLHDTERLEAAGVFLGRDIPENQSQAILDAHNHGERLEDGSYSLWDLREKTRILREAGFTSWEIRTLFDNNICGKEIPLMRSLYDDPRYAFLNTEPYRELKDMLWDLDITDKLWEWQNAIIIRHPNNDNKVLKIAKPWEVDDLMKEFNNHNQFYTQLEAWKIESRRLFEEWKIPESMVIQNDIRVPEIQIGAGDNPLYFEMERVDWQSFRTEYYRREYELKFNEAFWPEQLDTMTDAQIEDLVIELGLQHIPARIMDWDDWGRLAVRKSQEYMREQFSNWNHNSALWNAMQYLKYNWLEHTDLHAANFMRARDGTIYIIDFGNVNIK